MNGRQIRHTIFRQKALIWLHSFVSLVCMLVNYRRNGHSHDAWSWGRVLGLSILIPSFIFGLHARLTLADYASYSFGVFSLPFSLSAIIPSSSSSSSSSSSTAVGGVPSSHKLVTSGLYGYMRHPDYIASTCSMLGYLLFVHSRYGLVALLLVGAPVQYMRAKMEERQLHARYQHRYAAYLEALDLRGLLGGSTASVGARLTSGAMYFAVLVCLFAIAEVLVLAAGSGSGSGSAQPIAL